jgi:hypothetical protein
MHRSAAIADIAADAAWHEEEQAHSSQACQDPDSSASVPLSDDDSHKQVSESESECRGNAARNGQHTPSAIPLTDDDPREENSESESESKPRGDHGAHQDPHSSNNIELSDGDPREEDSESESESRGDVARKGHSSSSAKDYESREAESESDSRGNVSAMVSSQCKGARQGQRRSAPSVPMHLSHSEDQSHRGSSDMDEDSNVADV